MNDNRSVLQFRKYIVKEITYNTNELYRPQDELKLVFDFDTSTSFSEDKKRMEIELSSEIFKDSVANNYPFEMSLCLKGFFDIKSVSGPEGIQIFEKNAIAILFPYLRSLVSTYTANANVAPVILPAMNINAYIEKKKYREGRQI